MVNLLYQVSCIDLRCVHERPLGEMAPGPTAIKSQLFRGQILILLPEKYRVWRDESVPILVLYDVTSSDAAGAHTFTAAIVGEHFDLLGLLPSRRLFSRNPTVNIEVALLEVGESCAAEPGIAMLSLWHVVGLEKR